MGVRVILIEDHPVVRETLVRVLQRHPDIELLAHADDGEHGVRLSLELLPDVVVMDLALPTINGLEATRQIVAAALPVKVLIVSSHAESALVQAAVDAGAAGYVLKNRAGRELARAIRTVAGGERFFSHDSTQNPVKIEVA